MAVWWARMSWRTRWRSFAVLAVVAALVGGAALALVTGARRSTTAWDRLAARTTATDAQVFSFDGVSEAQRQQLSALEGVDEVVPAAALAVVPAGHDLVPFFGAAGFASADDRFLTTLEVPQVLEGRRADPASIGEAMVNETMTDATGLEVGDRVELESLTPDQMAALGSTGPGAPAGPTPTVEIVGVVKLTLDYAESEPDAALYLTTAFEERFGDTIARLDLAQVFLEPGADPAAFEADALAVFDGDPRYDIQTLDEASGRVRHSLEFVAAALWVLAAVALLVGLVVLFHLVGRHLPTREPEDGVLTALGARRRERVTWTLATMLPVVLLAAGGAVAVGGLIAPFTSVGVVDEIGLDRGPGVPAGLAALMTGAVALVLLGITAVQTVRPRARARHRPLLSGSGLPPVPHLAVRFAATGQAIGFVVIGIAGATAALVLMSSVRHLEDDSALFGFPWDAEIGLVGVEFDELDRDPGVAALGRIQYASAEVGEAQVPALGIDVVRGDLGYSIRSGEAPSAPDEVALGARTRETVGVGIGEVVEVRGLLGSAAFAVTGETVIPSSDTESPDDGLVFTLAGLRRIQPSPAEDDLPVAALVRYSDDPAGETSRRGHEAALTYFSTPTPPTEVVDLADLHPLGNPLVAFFAVLSITACAQASVGRTGRRRHDLAVLAALGLRPRQRHAALILGALLIPAASLLVAVPVGVVAGRTLWQWVVDGAGLVLHPVVALDETAATGVVTLAVAAGLGVVNALSLRRTEAPGPAGDRGLDGAR